MRLFLIALLSLISLPAFAQTDPCARWDVPLEAAGRMVRTPADAQAFARCHDILVARRAARVQPQSSPVVRAELARSLEPADACARLTAQTASMARLHGANGERVAPAARRQYAAGQIIAAHYRRQIEAGALKVAALEGQPTLEGLDRAMKLLACSGDDPTSLALAARVQTARAKLEAEAAAAEAKCQADPKCLKARRDAEIEELANQACGWTLKRDKALREIAEERRDAKRAGVIDLRLLQRLKEDLREAEDELKTVKAAFKKLARRAFSLKKYTCSEE